MLGEIYKSIAVKALEAQRMPADEMKDLLKTGHFAKIDAAILADGYIGEAVRSLRGELRHNHIMLPHGFTDYVKLGGMYDVKPLAEETASLSSERKAEIALMALMAMYDRTHRGDCEAWENVTFKDVMIYYMYLEPILDALKMTVSKDLIEDAWRDYWRD